MSVPNELWIKSEADRDGELIEFSVSAYEREGYRRYVGGDLLDNNVNALLRLVGRLGLALNDFNLMIEIKPLVGSDGKSGTAYNPNLQKEPGK